MTRITGSVPLARIRMRPRSPSFSSCAAISRCTAACFSGEAPAKRTFTRRCGSGVKTRQTSLAGRPLLDQHREHLQRRDQPVAGGGEIGHDHVAGLLAAEIAADLAHPLADIAVAHRGPEQRQPEPLR